MREVRNSLGGATLRALGWLMSAVLGATLVGCGLGEGFSSNKAADTTLPSPDSSTTDAGDASPKTDTGPTLIPNTLSITNVTPIDGPTGGGTLVVIEGAKFEAQSKVFFGSSPSPEVQVLSNLVIHARTPPHKPGGVDLTIKTPTGGVVTKKDAFIFRDPLSVTAIEPAQGPAAGGTPVVVRGQGFTSDTRILVGGRLLINLAVVGSDTVLGITPAGLAGHVDLIAVTGWTSTVVADGFRYTAAPTLTQVSPVTAPAGAPVTLTLVGSGLLRDAVVTVGGVVASLSDGDGAGVLHVTANAPVAGPADVVVSTQDGSATLKEGVTFLGPNVGAGALTILAATPSSGRSEGGDLVTLVVGGPFSMQPEVRFGEALATLTNVDAEARTVSVRTPAGTGLVDLRLSADGTTATRAGGFRYLALPTVDRIKPAAGPMTGGTLATIEGSRFEGVLSVTIGALPAIVRAASATSLDIEVPAGSPGPADVRVITAQGESVLLNGFDYRPLAGPEIYAVHPILGSIAGNTLVHIYGAGLSATGNGTTSIKFGDKAGGKLAAVSTAHLTVRAPKAKAPGAVDVALAVGSTTRTLNDGYTYFDPTSPYGGSWGPKIRGTVNVTVLDIYETKPIAGAFVMMWADPSTPFRGYTDDRGQITFSDPSIQGPQMVTAAKEQYSAMSVVAYDAENVNVHLIPWSPPTPPSTGGGGGPDVLPFAELRGAVFGLGKWIPPVPKPCSFQLTKGGLVGAQGTSNCQVCASDVDCGPSARCLDIASEGKHCSSLCALDSECPGGYVCRGNAGPGLLSCIPDPGTATAYCQVTHDRPWESPPAVQTPIFPGDDGSRAWLDPDGTFIMKTRPGVMAILCIGGLIRDPDNRVGSFLPVVMGIRRQVEPSPGQTLEHLDVQLDIPLSKTVPIRLDGAPETHRPYGSLAELPTTSELRAALNFGAEGTWEIPFVQQASISRFALAYQPQNLQGKLEGVSYDFWATVRGSGQAESGTRADRVKVLDVDRIFAFADGGWASVTSGVTRDIRAMWGDAPNNVWAVGDGGFIAHAKKANVWGPQASPTTMNLNAVFGTSEKVVYAVGDFGTVARFDGVSWKLEPSPTLAHLTGVSGTSGDAVVAVGDGVVLQRGGSTWSLVPGAPKTVLRSVWMPKPGVFWAVGDDGKVWRYDGTWSSETLGKGIGLRAIAGRTSVDPWQVAVVGAVGSVFTLTAKGTFEQVDVPTTEDLFAVAIASNGTLIAGGARGTVLRFDGQGFSSATTPKYAGDLLAVVAFADPTAAGLAAGPQVVSLGPMLQFPEIHEPVAIAGDGTAVFTYHLDWTSKPGAMPTFNYVEMSYQDFPVWWTIVKADDQDVDFPNLPVIEGINPFPGPGHVLRLNRVLKPGVDVDNFDFWDMYDGGSWKSWATDAIPFDPI